MSLAVAAVQKEACRKHPSFPIKAESGTHTKNTTFLGSTRVGYFRTTSIMEKEDVNKDRPDSECLWVLGKKYKGRRFTESAKYLFVPKMGLLGSQASTENLCVLYSRSSFIYSL